ncbi:MAG TPA: hypothetical protein VK194_08470 [Candidatus Deferrimicrobium sp.]|nr:hypothetical protein [Candidatus Deferrimicrobium sp.]
MRTTAGSVDPRRRTRSSATGGRARRAAVLGAALLVAVMIAACTTSPPNGSGRPGSVGPGVEGSSRASPDQASNGPTPQPTAWPGNAVIGIVGLGAGDNEIARAIADFSEAVAAENLVRMRGAAGGLENLVTDLDKQVDRISIYPPMSGLVDQYRAALGPMLDGARQLRAAIDAGDAQAILSATQRISDGMQAYGEVRGPLSAWVEQATAQQRLLVK